MKSRFTLERRRGSFAAVSIKAIPYDLDLVGARSHRFRGFCTFASGQEDGTHRYEDSHDYTQRYPPSCTGLHKIAVKRLPACKFEALRNGSVTETN
jgi:hypothetical protein